jgi:hypothetical protein
MDSVLPRRISFGSGVYWIPALISWTRSCAVPKLRGAIFKEKPTEFLPMSIN